MATKTKPTPAQLAARAKFAAAAKAGKFKRKATRKPAAKRKAATKRNPTASADRYMVAVNVRGVRRFVTGAQAGSPTTPTLGPYARAAVMTADRAAVVKSRLDAMGHRGAEAMPVETVDFADSTPDKLHDNPRKRGASNKMIAVAPDRFAYRRYFVQRGMNGVWYITYGTSHIGSAASPDAARRIIDELTAGDAQWQDNPSAVRKVTRGELRANPVRYSHVELRGDGFKFGADQTTPQLWHFATRETKGAYRSFRIPPHIVKSPDFQAWVRGNNGVLSDTYKGLLRKVGRFDQ